MAATTKLRSLLKRIEHNPQHRMYRYLCQKFIEYLEYTEHLTIDVLGQHNATGLPVITEMNYKHRWKENYQKAILAKFYKLDEWFESDPKDISFISLTTYQDGAFSARVKGHRLAIHESWELLNESKRKLLDIIKKQLRPDGLDYIWVLEPHLKKDTGYPHLHALFFTKFTESELEYIKKMWVEVYEAGSEKHAVKIETSEKQESIEKLRNYLIKYMSKTFVTDNSKYTQYNWTPGQLVFNAIGWLKKYRFWSTSRSLTKVMKMSDDYGQEPNFYDPDCIEHTFLDELNKAKNNITYYKTRLKYKGRIIAQMWQGDKYTFELMNNYLNYIKNKGKNTLGF